MFLFGVYDQIRWQMEKKIKGSQFILPVVLHVLGNVTETMVVEEELNYWLHCLLEISKCSEREGI